MAEKIHRRISRRRNRQAEDKQGRGRAKRRRIAQAPIAVIHRQIRRCALYSAAANFGFRLCRRAMLFQFRRRKKESRCRKGQSHRRVWLLSAMQFEWATPIFFRRQAVREKTRRRNFHPAAFLRFRFANCEVPSKRRAKFRCANRRHRPSPLSNCGSGGENRPSSPSAAQ